METNVERLPWGWNKIVRDSPGNVALFDFDGTHAATKIVFKLLKDVFCDFSDTNSIVIRQLII